MTFQEKRLLAGFLEIAEEASLNFANEIALHEEDSEQNLEQRADAVVRELREMRKKLISTAIGEEPEPE